jgi:iron-sulfur cluster repair protein YtfE (RIC family)
MEFAMPMEVPVSLKSGHQAITATLKHAMREAGAVGEAARKLGQVLDGHMLLEEKFALRPLGLLQALGRGEKPSDLAEAATVVKGLRREMPRMLDEHRQIGELLRVLAKAAEAEGKPEYVAFAEDLMVHAHLEEDVLYPAALLIGAYAAAVRGD